MNNKQTHISLKRTSLSALHLGWAYLAAVIVVYLSACLSQTALVLKSLTAAGASFAASDWLRAFAYDLYGLSFGGKYVSYSMLILIGLALALPSAALCIRWLPLPKALVYALAGATAMLTIVLLVRYNFYQLTLFAGTRGLAGMASQCVSGAFGGWLFSVLVQRRQGKPDA